MPEQFARFQKLIGSKTELINLPMIKVVQINENEQGNKQINNAANYDWVLFTSMKAVKFFFNIYKENIEKLSTVKFACVGISTQKKLAEYNIKTAYLNEGKTADDFANNLINKRIISASDKVMHPTSDKAISSLSKKLRDYCNFQTVVIYHTIGLKNISPKVVEKINQQAWSIVIFTSPSAFINFVEIAEKKIDMKKLKIAAIGKTTDKTIENLGFKSALVAGKPDLNTFAQEILQLEKTLHRKIS